MPAQSGQMKPRRQYATARLWLAKPWSCKARPSDVAAASGRLMSILTVSSKSTHAAVASVAAWSGRTYLLAQRLNFVLSTNCNLICEPRSVIKVLCGTFYSTILPTLAADETCWRLGVALTMNGKVSGGAKPAKRLTNLIYTDPLAQLPLAQLPQPPSAAAVDTATAAEDAFLWDASFLDQAASLLQATDVSYMCASCSRTI